MKSKPTIYLSYIVSIFGLTVLLSASIAIPEHHKRPRARDIGIEVGVLKPGKWNAITDVLGVKVGHTTVIKGDSIRTGITAVLPHDGNLFQNKVPAAVFVGNGFGKLLGSTQVEELGNIETPILLTNTLNVPKVADALIDYMLGLAGNENVRSVNPLVGETNDGWLNDIRGRHVSKEDVFQAIKSARSRIVEEGCVGAGTGTICLGFKGGIGTSSRILPKSMGGYTIGVLVQSNYGGILEINGAPVGRELEIYSYKDNIKYEDGDGSCMIVVATDAPLSSRNLKRLAKRAYLALAKTGAFSSNGSGDYVIAFSNNPQNLIKYNDKDAVRTVTLLNNDKLSPLFMAVVEATQEALYNALLKATTTKGKNGRTVTAVPIEEIVEICKKYNVLNLGKTLSKNNGQ
ncbi:P1 family peptidase [candidate division KSB1 bacterium]|nr:P1 family peptidase [candidate division KSB1 bacterium]